MRTGDLGGLLPIVLLRHLVGFGAENLDRAAAALKADFLQRIGAALLVKAVARAAGLYHEY